MLEGEFFPRPHGELPGSFEAINAELVKKTHLIINAVNPRHGRNDFEEGAPSRFPQNRRRNNGRRFGKTALIKKNCKERIGESRGLSKGDSRRVARHYENARTERSEDPSFKSPQIIQTTGDASLRKAFCWDSELVFQPIHLPSQHGVKRALG